MAVHDFAMPDLGEGLVEGTVVSWLVAEGDEVELDQPIVEIETEKALVEVPCPFAGVVVTIYVFEGGVVAVGHPLISIETGGTTSGSASGGVLVGYGTASPDPSRRRRGRTPDRADAEPTVPRGAPDGALAALATPAVRGLAKGLGVELGGLVGTGPGGTVTRADVQAAARTHPAGGPITPAGAPADPAAATGERRLALSGVRRAVAEKVARSRREVPEVTTWVDADATDLWEARREVEEANPGLSVSALAFVLRACVLAVERFPVLNARLDAAAGEIVIYDDVHLGVATQTPRGLMVPVLRAARARPVVELAAELNRLVDAARAGRIAPAELAGATISVSNYGAFGVDGGTPIINLPEVAILGVGRFAERPHAHRGSVALRRVVQLSLAFDHRVCDGLEAASFLRTVADGVESPGLLLA